MKVRSLFCYHLIWLPKKKEKRKQGEPDAAEQTVVSFLLRILLKAIAAFTNIFVSI